MRRFTAMLLAAALAAGCTGVPDGVRAVQDFEIERYLGTWYEIARLDHRFERGLTSVTAQYSLRDDGGIRVVNRGFDAGAGTWEQAVGKAYPIGAAGEGRLKVSFFGPFYGGYNIIELDDDYRYSMVAGPNRGYLWILAREPVLDPEVLDRLIRRAASLGFPTDELILVEHGDDAGAGSSSAGPG